MELRTELVLIAISAMIGMVFGIGLAKGIDYSFFSAFGAMLAGIGFSQVFDKDFTDVLSSLGSFLGI